MLANKINVCPLFFFQMHEYVYIEMMNMLCDSWVFFHSVLNRVSYNFVQAPNEWSKKHKRIKFDSFGQKETYMLIPFHSISNY